MRAVVTCECCGHRQAVARAIAAPQSFHVVCHSCEGILKVEVTARDLRTASTSSRRVGSGTRRAEAGGTEVS